MHTYEEPVKFEEKRVRSIVGSILYGLGAFGSIAQAASFRMLFVAGAVLFAIGGVFYIVCNLENVKQWQYRVLGCIRLLTIIITLIYIPVRAVLLPLIFEAFMMVPMMLPMESRILYLLRPISIVKSPLPVASPQVITMVSPIMPPMMSPQMNHTAYPTMSSHVAYATSPGAYPPSAYPPGTYPPGTYPPSTAYASPNHQ